MAISIPSPGNPFQENISVQRPQEMGLTAIPKTEYGMEGVAKGIGNVGQMIIKAADENKKAVEKWQEETDKARIKDGILQMKKKSIELKATPETGWANQMGKHALDKVDGRSLKERTLDAFQKTADELIAGCSNDRQRKALTEARDGFLFDIGMDVDGHVWKQSEVYNQSVNEMWNNEALNDLASPSSSRADEASALQFLVQAGKEAAQKAGVIYDPKSISPAHSILIGKRLDGGDIKGAKAHLAKYEDQMKPADIARARVAIRQEIKRQEVEARAGKIRRRVAREYTDSGVFSKASKAAGGPSVTEQAYAKALEIAGGNKDHVGVVLAVGEKAYRDAREKQEADRALRADDVGLAGGEGIGARSVEEFLSPADKAKVGKLKVKIEQYGRVNSITNADDMKAEFATLFPNADPKARDKAARAKASANKQRIKVENQRKEDALTVALEALRMGGKMEDLPADIREGLDPKTLQAMQTAEKLEDNGARVTDMGIRYDLMDDDARLKAMTRSELYQQSKYFSRDDFKELEAKWTYLQTRRGEQPKSSQFRTAARSAVSDLGYEVPTSQPKKVVYEKAVGLVAEAIADEYRRTGKAPNEDQARSIANRLIKANHRISGPWYRPDASGFEAFFEGNTLAIGRELEGMLDAGISRKSAGGIKATDTLRTNLLADIVLRPGAPIPGAVDMQEYVRTHDPRAYNEIMKAYRGNVDPNRFVRQYLAKKKLVGNLK